MQEFGAHMQSQYCLQELKDESEEEEEEEDRSFEKLAQEIIHANNNKINSNSGSQTATNQIIDMGVEGAEEEDSPKKIWPNRSPYSSSHLTTA